MSIDYSFHKVKSKPEALDVMDVTGGHAIEFLKDIFQILFFDTYAVIFYRNKEVVFVLSGLDDDMRIGGILERILQQVDERQFELGSISKVLTGMLRELLAVPELRTTG